MTEPSSCPHTRSMSASNSSSVTMVPYRVYSCRPLHRARQENSESVMPALATSSRVRQQLPRRRQDDHSSVASFLHLHTWDAMTTHSSISWL